mmetsp:Transcript_114865/g.310226  ORF Transcript_114865/g.310226 Transcript_114865/m.310226 type:complete len:254 (-) Transcript_114865:61-822(-)
MEGVALVGALHVIQEVGSGRRQDLEAQGRQERALRVEDVALAIRVVGDVYEARRVRRVDLLELRRDEHGDDPNKLQAAAWHVLPREVAVEEARRQEERVLLHLVLDLHIDEPIDQDVAHVGVDLGLGVHVVGVGHQVQLCPEEDIENVLDVLAGVLGVLRSGCARGWWSGGGRRRSCGGGDELRLHEAWQEDLVGAHVADVPQRSANVARPPLLLRAVAHLAKRHRLARDPAPRRHHGALGSQERRQPGAGGA